MHGDQERGQREGSGLAPMALPIPESCAIKCFIGEPVIGCFLDSCTSLSKQGSLLPLPSKTENAQGWGWAFGMTEIQGSSSAIALTLHLLLMLHFKAV